MQIIGGLARYASMPFGAYAGPVTDLSSSPDRGPAQPLRVVIVGGGVAALELALALRHYAGARVSLTLVAPNHDFVYRPQVVQEPFGYGRAERHPLREIVHDLDAEHLVDSFGWVAPAERVVHLQSRVQVPYDALVLAPGAKAVVRYPHALTINDANLDQMLHGLLVDIEGGYVKRLAFVVPARMAWPLPIYELALMTARRAHDTSAELAITLVTPEDAPLAIFGSGASDVVAGLLAQAGVRVITSARAEVPEWSRVVLGPGDHELQVDRVVALPELFGPAVRGLASAENGFIPVDRHGQVRGAPDVYAAGDATDFPVKHGGLGAQQADVVAQAIAARAGVQIEPQSFRPVIQAMLLTGGKPCYLSARITAGHGFASEISDTASWSPTGKIAAKYLAPYLHQRGPLQAPTPT
jgi:sulfide:quinone oxidoreductase